MRVAKPQSAQTARNSAPAPVRAKRHWLWALLALVLCGLGAVGVYWGYFAADPSTEDFRIIKPATQQFFSRSVEQKILALNRQLITAQTPEQAVASYDHLIAQLDQERRILAQIEVKTDAARDVLHALQYFVEKYLGHARVARKALLQGNSDQLIDATLQMNLLMHMLPQILQEARKAAAQHGVQL